MLAFASGWLLSQQPDAFESLLASAQQAQARSDFQAAAGFYRQAVALRPEIAELRANLGLMYYQIGNNREAADAFEHAIRLKPGLFVPNLFLGLDYVREKRFNQAIPYLKRASLLNPSDIEAQLALGQAYAGSGNTRLACRSYLRATQIQPQNADAWYRLGVSYLEQVEADARVLLARHKESGYLQALIADNFSEQHQFIQAAEAYKKALAAPQFPAEARVSYAFVLINEHELTDAERELNAELKASPGSLMAKLGMARLHVEQGEMAEGADELREIWKSDAMFVHSNVERFTDGLDPQKRSEFQRVVEQKQMAGELPPELGLLLNGDASTPNSAAQATEEGHHSSDTARLSAAKLYAQGQHQRCLSELSIERQRPRSDELRVLAACAYWIGDYAQAISAAAKLSAAPATEAEGLYWETKSAQKLAADALERASQIDSGSPKLHVLLGDLYRQKQSFPQAEKEYRKALAIAPHDAGALFGLSLALLADNHLDDAFQVAHAALQGNSDDPELNAVMGEILCARDDFSRAEPYLKKGLNTKPEYVPHVHALLGSVYAHTDRVQQAIAELKLALPADKDGRIHYQLARLYLKVGDRESAKEAFEASERLRVEGLSRAEVAMHQGQADDNSQ